MQILLAVCAAALALFAFAASPVQVFVIFFFMMAVISATHDIAIDGFYIDALGKDQQAAFSGMKVAAYRLAMLTGNGFLVALSGSQGWGVTFAVAAVILSGLTLWHSYALPRSIEKREQAEHEKNHETRVPFIEGFREFLKIPGVAWVFLFAIVFKIGDAMLFAMSTPFLLDSGVSKAELGFYNGVLGTIAGITAAMVGGYIISKKNLRFGILCFGIIQNFAIPVYTLVAILKPPPWGFALAVIVEQIAAGLGQSAYMNFLMRQNRPGFKATHYAIVTGLMSLTVMFGGAASGFLASRFGYAHFFMIAFGASLPGLFILRKMAQRPECQ
jgi:PAT family beta-lactamase induction signal transducer AmpG